MLPLPWRSCFGALVEFLLYRVLGACWPALFGIALSRMLFVCFGVQLATSRCRGCSNGCLAGYCSVSG
ncbi:hypothetical protein SAMN05216604_11271 [Pseudomonas agarici]|nr:hypothetical protein SAMN05216604_11271 [Pseudomonas agarici]